MYYRTYVLKTGCLGQYWGRLSRGPKWAISGLQKLLSHRKLMFFKQYFGRFLSFLASEDQHFLP